MRFGRYHEPGCLDSDVAQVSRAIEGSGVPVLINTGFKMANAVSLLAIADGAIVGSSLKTDGITWNPVDPERVRTLMETVRSIEPVDF